MYIEEHDAMSNAIHAYYTAITAFRDCGLDLVADRLEPDYQALCRKFNVMLAQHDQERE
jgi:hypothetical protein